MKKIHFGANFTVFVLFFGIALLEAFRENKWIVAIFWLIAGLLFLRADNIHREKN
jgi:hypothetical protein